MTDSNVNNITISSLSGMPALFVAVESQTALSIASAVVLPVLFFILGKTADILLQIYLKKRSDGRNDK